jgi:hypothetical protein
MPLARRKAAFKGDKRLFRTTERDGDIKIWGWKYSQFGVIHKEKGVCYEERKMAFVMLGELGAWGRRGLRQ